MLVIRLVLGGCVSVDWEVSSLWKWMEVVWWRFILVDIVVWLEIVVCYENYRCVRLRWSGNCRLLWWWWWWWRWLGLMLADVWSWFVREVRFGVVVFGLEVLEVGIG